jgi:hypothetical protein
MSIKKSSLPFPTGCIINSIRFWCFLGQNNRTPAGIIPQATTNQNNPNCCDSFAS